VSWRALAIPERGEAGAVGVRRHALSSPRLPLFISRILHFCRQPSGSSILEAWMQQDKPWQPLGNVLVCLGTHTAPSENLLTIGRLILFELISCGKVLDVLGTPKRMRSDGQARRSLADIFPSAVSRKRSRGTLRLFQSAWTRNYLCSYLSRCRRQIRQFNRHSRCCRTRLRRLCVFCLSFILY